MEVEEVVRRHLGVMCYLEARRVAAVVVDEGRRSQVACGKGRETWRCSGRR